MFWNRKRKSELDLHGATKALLSELATIQIQVTTLSERLEAISSELREASKRLEDLSAMSLITATDLSSFFSLVGIRRTPTPTTDSAAAPSPTFGQVLEEKPQP